MKKITVDKKHLKYYMSILLMLAFLCLSAYLIDYSINHSKAKTADTQISKLTHISYSGVEGESALALLKAKYKVEAKDSSAGSFVTAIGGVKNTNDTFWMYYVNGKQGTVASDTYQTKKGDKIEWKYEKFQIQ